MIEYNSLRVLMFAALLLVLVWIVIAWVRSTPHRIVLLATLFGFAIYSGIGTLESTTPFYLFVYFFIFAGCLVASFALGLRWFRPIASAASAKLQFVVHPLIERKYGFVLIGFFVGLHLLKLCFPEMRLGDLFSPPPMDFRGYFAERFIEDSAPAKKVIEYFIILLTPLFYISLYLLRRQPTFIAAILFLILYIQYANTAYVSRGEIVFQIAFIFISAWIYRPEWRGALVVATVFSVPAALTALYSFQYIRLDATADDLSFSSVINGLMGVEFRLMPTVGLYLFESGAQVEFQRYLAWLFTLPLPSFLKADIDVALINHEISEIFLGLPAGERGYYIVLPGLLGESAFIYGPNLFWLHAIFLGIVAAFVTSILSNSRACRFILIYFALIQFYTLNRGGIAASLPLVLNGLLLVYLVILFASARPRRRMGSRAK